jgi:hypothetical protein
MTRAVPILRALRQAHRAPKSKAPEISIRHRLERISSAWDDFQASRTRDAVYGYLDAVFAIVEHYKVRRRTKRLLWRTAKFSGLPVESNADPLTAVIRCTSGNGVDSKKISKWARALRYAARSKEPAATISESCPASMTATPVVGNNHRACGNVTALQQSELLHAPGTGGAKATCYKTILL